jgi:hypothetical protein
MKNVIHFIVAGIFLFASSAQAEETAAFAPAPTLVPMKSPTSAAPTDTTFKKSAGITDSADKTKDSNKKGQMLNQLVGIANLGMAANCFAQCGGSGGGCCPAAPIFLLMGLQNMAQSGAQGKTAGQAAGTVGQTDIGTTGYDPSLAADPDLKKGTDFVTSVTNVKAKDKGFSYDPATGTVTSASGKTLSGKDVSSAAAMAAAGVSKGVIDTVSQMNEKALASAMKKVESKLGKIAVNGEEMGAGGGGGDSSSSRGSATADPAYGAGRGAGLGIDRDPAQVAGMQKNYNGEPIGVSGDSIFKMMTRRYKTKESQNNFLEDAELLMQK